MTLEQLADFFGWMAILNYFILTLWFLVFVVAKDWLFEIHYSWFDISKEQFNLLHYRGIAYYKIFLFVFNLMPFVALKIML